MRRTIGSNRIGKKIGDRIGNRIAKVLASTTALLALGGLDVASRGLAQDSVALGAGKAGLVSGVEKENFSKTLKASEDFFRFVNENWLETTDIPADQSNYGAFTALDIETKAAIRAIIEEASLSADASAEAKQVGNFFKSYIDIEARNKECP